MSFAPGEPNAFGNALGNSIVGQMKYSALPEKVKQAALTDPDAINNYEVLRRNGVSEVDATEAVQPDGLATQRRSGPLGSPNEGNGAVADAADYTGTIDETHGSESGMGEPVTATPASEEMLKQFLEVMNSTTPMRPGEAVTNDLQNAPPLSEEAHQSSSQAPANGSGSAEALPFFLDPQSQPDMHRELTLGDLVRNSVGQWADEAGPPNDGVARTPKQLAAYEQAWTDLQEPRIHAFLETIALYESGGSYDVRYDGSSDGATFSDFSKHPNVAVRLSDGQKTTAAGAYQITNTTWNEVNKNLALPDFSPPSQDLAAAALLRSSGASHALISGQIGTAIKSAAVTWEALKVNAPPRITYQYNQFLKKY